MSGKRLNLFLVFVLVTVTMFSNFTVSALAPFPQDTTVVYHPLTGMARYMGAPMTGKPIREAAALEKASSDEEVARLFLEAEGGAFGIVDARNDLSVRRETNTDIGTSTVRFQQKYMGIPVLGGEIVVHMDSQKNVLSANGEILPNISLDVTPVIDAATAAQTALERVARDHGVSVGDLQTSDPELWIYNPALLTPYKGETVLGWRMEVTPKSRLLPIRELVLVDVKRGNIALNFNQVDTAKNRQTYDAGGTSTRPGTLVCNESNPTCAGGSADAVNAHVYAGQTYDFFMSTHGRDSIDGVGMSLISTVNYDNDPSDGVPYENAFWDGQQMTYGAGFASADDVVAHELTHGVTEHTSNLFYYYQSGAINESFSDVWGEFVDLGNGAGTDTSDTRWQMGEDLTSFGVIRDMSDPTLYGDPDKMTSPNYYQAPFDSGGVHSNSGVNNKAVYLMVDGDTFNGKTVTGMGITKVAKIYYYVQTNLLVSGSDYADLYYALQTACSALVGTSGITASDCQEFLDAADAVEMDAQPVTDFNTDVNACDVAGRYPANRFFDDMESGTANWVSGAQTGTDRWTYGSIYGLYAYSGQNFLYADDYPDTVADTYLRMANSVAVPASGKLLFHHAYGFDFDPNTNTYYDGGVLEYSTNGGSSWADASSMIDTNGYDGTLQSGLGNPLSGQSAFVGDSHGYITTRLDLSSLAGQSVVFRWRMGLDSASYNWGWWLDDTQLYECVRFSDVGTNHWAYSWIETLAANNITSGCDVGMYCPAASVTRAQMAIFILRGIHGSAYTPPAATGTVFTDVPANHWAAAWIEQLAAEGITGGCGNGNYCPDANITRAQMAIFLLRGEHGSAYTPPAATGTIFTDVPVGSFAADWIEQLYNEGITGGCGSGTYCPDANVLRDQMAVFLVKTFNLP